MENMKIDRKCKFRKKSLKVQRTADTIKKKNQGSGERKSSCFITEAHKHSFSSFPLCHRAAGGELTQTKHSTKGHTTHSNTHTHEHTDTPHTHAKY